MESNQRRTKVIKSYEASAITSNTIAELSKQHVDVVRLVYHRADSEQILSFVKELDRQKLGKRRFPVMLDLACWNQGNIINLTTPLELSFGQKVTFGPAKSGADCEIQSKAWDKLFNEQASVYVGAGQAVLKVLPNGSSRDAKVDLEVVQGGTVFPGMEIYVPETRREFVREKTSVQDLKKLLDAKVDYLILPGQWPREVFQTFKKDLLNTYGEEGSPWIFAKVDSADACEMLPDIIDSVEGALISRRELALSVNPATVPMITKEIIQLCSDHGKLIVTASEMLASMRRNATPTRAEVSDVANAVLDGTDAVVLSEEVANGKYGDLATSAMHRIICDIEQRSYVHPNWMKASPKVEDEMDAIAFQGMRTAERVNAKAIVCITKAGNTALKLASYRPHLPVVAVTYSADVLRRLAIVRGVEGILLNVDPKIDEVLPVVSDLLMRESWLRSGDPIIFVTLTISPLSRTGSNLFTVQYLN